MSDASELPGGAADVAERLAGALDSQGIEYAFGGAIALAFWGEPRGTVDVDVTLFVAPDAPAACVRLLQDLGCDLDPGSTQQMIADHGFARVEYHGTRVDVFLPIVPFYEAAKERRARVELGDATVSVWKPEVLAVFKMMFFRLKDLADLEQVLRTQGSALDRTWVRAQLREIYGERDPRLPRWDELCRAADAQG